MKQKVKFNMPPLGAQYAKQQMKKGVNNVKNPVSKDEATTKITKMITESKIPPEIFAQIGTLAENAINDKSQYQKFVDYMVEKKMETAEDLKKPDLQMLASLVVIGKVAETLQNIGEQPTEQTQQVQEQITEPVSGPVAPTQGL